LIGVLAAVCLVFILDRIRPRLYSPESIGGATQMPLLGLLSRKRGTDAAVARRLLRMATARRITLVSPVAEVRVGKLVGALARVANDHQLRVVLLDISGRTIDKAVRIRPAQQSPALPETSGDGVTASSVPWVLPANSNGDYFQAISLSEEDLLLSEAARVELEAGLLGLRNECDAFLVIVQSNLDGDEVPVRLNHDDGAVLFAATGVDARLASAAASSIQRSAATPLGVVVADSSR
jgi:hypothetical protein